MDLSKKTEAIRAVCIFGTDSGGKFSFSIPRADAAKTGAAAKAAMDAMIATGALCEQKGKANVAMHAKIVTTTRVKLA